MTDLPSQLLKQLSQPLLSGVEAARMQSYVVVNQCMASTKYVEDYVRLAKSLQVYHTPKECSLIVELDSDNMAQFRDPLL